VSGAIEKCTEALGPVIDLVSIKAYMTNYLSFRFDFLNLAMTLLITIREVFGEFSNDEES